MPIIGSVVFLMFFNACFEVNLINDFLCSTITLKNAKKKLCRFTCQHFMIQITVQQEALSFSKVRLILCQVLLLIGLWMLMEISLHYFYTTALQQVRVVLVILAEAII